MPFIIIVFIYNKLSLINLLMMYFSNSFFERFLLPEHTDSYNL